MTITIELPPEVNQWMAGKLESGHFTSPADFIQTRLYQDWLDEKIEEALEEPATPLTDEDGSAARRHLEDSIAPK